MTEKLLGIKGYVTSIPEEEHPAKRSLPIIEIFGTWNRRFG